MIETTDKLIKRILILNERVWEQRMPRKRIEEWLDNFSGRVTTVEIERLHALFWLSQFMYFGSREIRVLLRAVYRDLYLCPVLQELQLRAHKRLSDDELAQALNEELAQTRFFGIGNPSESGVHLLYYFRQENKLEKNHFMDAVQIFSREAGSNTRLLRKPTIKRYIFLDDICGSGKTAIDYSTLVLDDLLRLNPKANVAYYSLFASKQGLDNVRNRTLFGENCAAVYELDPSYKCLATNSRYFGAKDYPDIDPELAVRIALEYGQAICNDIGCDLEHAGGYDGSQMLMGFHHNTPDNTLPMIWYDSASEPRAQTLIWQAAFKRYPKFDGAIISF
jgi:hypothetical protein